jgi:hypothetical protein
MKPAVIEGANANPGAPRDWDPERDGTCGKLPVRVTVETRSGGCGKWPPGDGDRVASCESAWELQPGELDLLKAGGRVILYVAGWQVPLSLRVEPALVEAPKAEAKIDG